MNEKLKTNGITLMSLVITIVVMLILVGVAIASTIDSDGLIRQSEKNVKDWNNRIVSDEEEINSIWDMESSGGKKTKTLTIPADLMIGDTVNWTPSGTYTQWKANYYSDIDTVDKVLYSGADATTAGATTSTYWEDNTTAIDMTISSWKVLGVDTTNNIVKLVPSAPTVSGVKLHGAQGYNNGVKLLNNACDALYGGTAGSSDGITARSISMIDIDNAMTITDELATTIATYGYGKRFSSEYSVKNSKYPVIYGEEALRKINGVESSTGIGMSEEATTGLDTNGFIPRVNGLSNIVENARIHPTDTHYQLSNESFAAALGYPFAGYTGTNGPFLPNGSSTRDYWVASRCVSTSGSVCYFGVRGVYVGILGASLLFHSYNNKISNTYGLFPVVSLSSGVLDGSNHVYTYTSGS